MPQQDLSRLLLNPVFHKCLLVCAVEVVMATYRTPCEYRQNYLGRTGDIIVMLPIELLRNTFYSLFYEITFHSQRDSLAD